MRPKRTKNKSTKDVPAFSQQDVKKEGKVYTPYDVIDDILDQFPYVEEQSTNVCDPSCGQGNFLMRIFRRRLKKGISTDDAFASLVGFEKDFTAIEVARQNFVDAGVSTDLVEKNLQCCDTTLIFSNYLNQFDVVIGNPPYVKNPSKTTSQLTLWDNLVDTFCEIGMSLLKSKGKLIYIVQDAFYTNEASNLRTFLEQFDLKTIEHRYDFSRAFRRHDIAVDIGLLEVWKGEQEEMVVQVRRHHPFTLAAERLKGNKWLLVPEHLLQLNDKLKQSGEPLTNHWQVQKGRTCNSKKETISGSYSSTNYKRQQCDTHQVPVLGEKNTDFFFPKTLEGTLFTKFTSNKKSRKETSVPFIVLPYYTSNFRFCLIEEDCFASPLLYVISGEELEALLPLLNSTPVDFLIRMNTKSRDTSYEFKMSTFNEAIVVPELNDAQREQLKEYTRLIRKQSISVSEVDQWVSKSVYGLIDEEIQLMKEAQEYYLRKHVKQRQKAEEWIIKR